MFLVLEIIRADGSVVPERRKEVKTHYEWEEDHELDRIEKHFFTRSQNPADITLPKNMDLPCRQ